MKYAIASILLLMSVSLSNAATYQVTVSDADVPTLNAFLADTANTNQAGTSTAVDPDGLAIVAPPEIPLTPEQYFTALVETFMGGLREQAKKKWADSSIKRLESLTPEEKAFVTAYEKLPPTAKQQLIKSVVMPSVDGH